MTHQKDDPEAIYTFYRKRGDMGVSSKGHVVQSVQVRPRVKGRSPRSTGGTVARNQDGEALRQTLRKEVEQRSRS